MLRVSALDLEEYNDDQLVAQLERNPEEAEPDLPFHDSADATRLMKLPLLLCSRWRVPGSSVATTRNVSLFFLPGAASFRLLPSACLIRLVCEAGRSTVSAADAVLAPSGEN